jgi:hypothetical protein
LLALNIAVGIKFVKIDKSRKSARIFLEAISKIFHCLEIETKKNFDAIEFKTRNILFTLNLKHNILAL